MRTINLRLSLFCFVALSLGVFAAVEALYGNLAWLWVFVAAFVIAIVLTVIFKRSKWYVAVLVCVFAVVGVLSTYRLYDDTVRREIVEERVTLQGRVTDMARNGNTVNMLYLEDCRTDDYRLPGIVKVPVYNPTDYSTGDIVTFDGTLRSTYVFKSYVDTISLRQRTYYSLDADELIDQQSGNLRLEEIVRKYVYDTVCDYAEPQSAGILYALITGDRNALDPTVSEMFRLSGIVHLLAVSGLHVGVVTALFALLLRLFKLRPLCELAILLVPLLFYAYICGFSPSVMRAVIMLCCVYISRALFGKADLLSSLSWAGIVLLLVNPLYLYDAGFKLSFLSVYGIATLYFALSRLIAKCKMPKFAKSLVDSVAMSVSCTVTTAFCLLRLYGETTLIGVLCNIVAIPMVSLAFVLGLVGLLPWVIHYASVPADYLLRGVVKIADFASKHDVTKFSIRVSILCTIVLVVWLFAACGYVRLTKKSAPWVNGAFAVVLAVVLVFCALPQRATNQAFVAHGYGDNIVVAMSDEGECAVATNFCDEFSLPYAVSFVSKYNVKRIDWYVTDFASCDLKLLKACVSAERGDRVIIADNSGNDEVTKYLVQNGIELVFAARNTPVGKYVVGTAVYDGGLRAVVLQTGDLTVAKVCGNKTQVEQFAYLRDDIDVYVTDYAYQTYAAQNKTVLSMYQSKLAFNLGASRYGNFTIRPKDGTIVVGFR